jgi:cephalosporin-C deacetylase-like acetyl esterase
MFQRVIRWCAASVLIASVGLGADTTKQQQTLDDLLRVLPRSAPWEAWLKSSGELPPDFSKLPSNPLLPDPLVTQIGAHLKAKSQWPARREELLNLFQHYVTGTIPPPPGNVRLAERTVRDEGSARSEQLLLEFGPEHRAKLHAEVIVPKGKGPFPVFITQDNHRRWALIAVSRGYIACVYAGADSNDDTGAWTNIWPQHDWTKLTRRAWAASRCIDYLLTRDDVDRDRIALTGHSRNGKTSIIAAAFDERISAIISSSSGAGGSCSFRFFSERQAGEGIEMITRAFPDWLHPRLRFFAGREEKLPIDMPELIACITPRPFLFATALNDSVESAWAIEQSHANARRSYDLFGEGNAINILYREGAHATDANEIERYVDWLDWKFGRSKTPVASERIYPTYDEWLKLSGEQVDPRSFGAVSSETPRVINAQVLKQLRWMLGDEPPLARSEAGAYGSEVPHMATLLGRNSVPNGIAKRSLNFGNYIAGDVYFPTNADTRAEKLPAIVWLHPISVSHGYVPGYRRGESPHLAFARAGFVVFAFDQIGNGSRIEEIKHFYIRHPHWSLLGKTVADTRGALDALGTLKFVDTNKVWIVGFDTGSSAALHTAALDSRVRGVACISGFAQMRPALSNRGEPMAAKFQHELPLVPRLGAFVGHKDRLPYDHRELVETLAPRKALLFVPRIDEQVDANDLARIYTPMKHVSYAVLDDYNRFGPETQKVVIEALRRASALGEQ